MRNAYLTLVSQCFRYTLCKTLDHSKKGTSMMALALTTTRTLVGQIKNTTQLRWNRIHRFKNKIEMNIEVGQYVIKTADSVSELIESFKLRHEVFNQEFRELEGDGLDFDRFDYYFDHLIILHKATRQVIGTYRLNCSTFSAESYTALEFSLSCFTADKGPYLELGRACIKKEFRKGSIITLLWRGIAEYMKLSNSNILFGCSSLKINNARDAALVYRYLCNNNFRSQEFYTKPTLGFRMPNIEDWLSYFEAGLSERQNEEAEKLIPSLLKSYLKNGAKIAAMPAFDRDFDCIDILTVLKREDMASAIAERFQVVR